MSVESVQPLQAVVILPKIWVFLCVRTALLKCFRLYESFTTERPLLIQNRNMSVTLCNHF